MTLSLIEYNAYMEQNNFNKETIKALKEAERIAKDPNTKHYSDVEEALKDRVSKLVRGLHFRGIV